MQPRDEELRVLLAAELKQLGMPSGDAEKYANWKRYDQNTGAGLVRRRIYVRRQ